MTAGGSQFASAGDRPQDGASFNEAEDLIDLLMLWGKSGQGAMTVLLFATAFLLLDVPGSKAQREAMIDQQPKALRIIMRQIQMERLQAKGSA